MWENLSNTVGKNCIRKRERVMVNAFTVCFWQERSKIIQYNLRFRLDLQSGVASQCLKYLKFPSPFLSFRNTENFVINWKRSREKSEVKNNLSTQMSDSSDSVSNTREEWVGDDSFQTLFN